MTTATPARGPRVAFDIGAQVIGRLGNLALGVVATVVLVRALGADGFGQWATITALVSITTLAGDFGIQSIAVRNAVADPDQESNWMGALLSLRVALAVPLSIASAGAVLLLATGPEMRLAGLILAAGVLLGAPSAADAVFQLRVRNDVTVAVMTVNSVLWTAAVVVIWQADGGMVPLAAALVATNLVTAAILVALATRAVPLRFDSLRQRWGELLRLGTPIGIAGILTLAYARIDQILVFELAGDRAAGLYGAAYRVLDSLGVVPLSVMTTLFPLIAAAHPVDMTRVRRLVQRAVDYLSMVSLPVLAFTLVASEEIARFLFGAQLADAGQVLPILMAAYIAICFGYIAGNLMVVLGLQRAFVRYALIGLVVNVALNLILVPSYGFVAAAWVTLVTEVLVNALAGRVVLRELELRPEAGTVLRVVAAVAVTAAVIVPIHAAGGGLVLLVAVTAALYVPLLFALGALRWQEVGAYLRKAPG
jgi:O-antigen/teichoic acid export membrane protein